MIDMASITIRRVNSIGIAYGEPVPHEDLPAGVLDAVECEVIEADNEAGRVEVGGQRYEWEKDSDLVTVDIMEYDTADNLGEAEMPRDEWELYAAESHPAYQWPQGIARAGDVLSRDQLDAIDLNPETTIYLE